MFTLPYPTISLVGIGVLPAVHGKGIGETLMKAFEKKAIQQGGKSLQLSVYPKNTGARGLYEKTGWQSWQGVKSASGAMYYYKIIS